MPAGARVFNLPYIPYPEVPQLHLMGTYEHARGYLLTDTLVWSYGAIKNREADAWNESVAHDGRHQLLRRVAARGFDGIFIDKRGMTDPHRDAGDALIAELRQAAEGPGRVRLPVIFHEDGRQAFLDIRPYRDWLRAQDPVQFETWAREEREWVAVTWLHGFHSPEPYGLRSTFRWGYKAGTAVIVNPADLVKPTASTTVDGVVLAHGVELYRSGNLSKSIGANSGYSTSGMTGGTGGSGSGGSSGGGGGGSQ